MKTNCKFRPYNKPQLKRKFVPESDEDLSRYVDDSDSEKFEVREYKVQRYDHRGHVIEMHTGLNVALATKVYDSSKPRPQEGLYNDRLLYLSRLAIAFYNMREDTYFGDVKVLMATRQGCCGYNLYITFQASESNNKVPITFQTKILIPLPRPLPEFHIMFVRIKPDHNKSKRRQPSVSDHKAHTYEDRLAKIIREYTIDSQFDSRYSLALYLSQYALVSHLLSDRVSKCDIESLKVLKFVQPKVEVSTYIITFQAPLLAVTEGKSVETFETEICMPTLFPTTTIELKSKVRVIQPNMDASEVKPNMDASEVKHNMDASEVLD